MDKSIIIEKLRTTLPPVFGRTEINRLFPGILHNKTQANRDSCGEGCPHYKMGRKVFYDRDVFLEWFEKKIKKIEL